MQAIHSTWTKPRIYGSGVFGIEDFDILTTILSALKWREKNGSISMITDSIGAEFYKSRGMSGIWNNVKTTLDDIPDTIDPEKFWAAGKLFALKDISAPTAVLDTDFIVWDKLAFDNLPGLTVIHDEEISPEIYPDINSFNMKQGYIFNPEFNWNVKPFNAAFYVVKSEEFREQYVKTAVDFMERAEHGDRLTYMVFAEQRLMAMMAACTNTEVKVLSNIERLFKDGERYFTHTWGMKQQMRDNPGLRVDFCRRCIERIKHDFPEYEDMLDNIPELVEYN